MVFGTGTKFRIRRSQSSYRKEPREKDKGVPTFQGSYKRTMSPSGVPRYYTTSNQTLQIDENCNSRGIESVETYGPQNDSCSEKQNGFISGRVDSNNLHERTLPSHSFTNDSSLKDSSFIANAELLVLQRVPEFSQTLPRNYSVLTPAISSANAAASAFLLTPSENKRCTRTPRTQSDPSTVPSSKDMSLFQQASSSSLSLQKSDSALSATGTSMLRSQSDLSNVGSMESGYSSLSLNLPSPSTSPTRLSSERVDHVITEKKNNDWSHTETLYNTDQCCQSGRGDSETKAIQSSELVMKVEPAVCTTTVLVKRTSDVASQTENLETQNGSKSGLTNSKCSRETNTSPMLRQKLQEEIECEELSRDLISHLSPTDRLHGILAPKPDAKTPMDYVSEIFQPQQVRSSISTSVACSLTAVVSVASQSEETRWLETNRYSVMGGCSKLNPHSLSSLTRKKEELVSRLDRKLKVLREEQVAVMEECRNNEALGEAVGKRVCVLASAHEASKFKLHVQEIGHITSLLLGLSSRLARVENTLLELSDENRERKMLEGKRDKLASQLEEAKALKENIDRRGANVSGMLQRYFSEEEFADYNHFISMKSKLLIDSREIADKIQLGEEQLTALKETLTASNNNSNSIISNSSSCNNV